MFSAVTSKGVFDYNLKATSKPREIISFLTSISNLVALIREVVLNHDICEVQNHYLLVCNVSDDCVSFIYCNDPYVAVKSVEQICLIAIMALVWFDFIQVGMEITTKDIDSQINYLSCCDACGYITVNLHEPNQQVVFNFSVVAIHFYCYRQHDVVSLVTGV